MRKGSAGLWCQAAVRGHWCQGQRGPLKGQTYHRSDASSPINEHGHSDGTGKPRGHQPLLSWQLQSFSSLPRWELPVRKAPWDNPCSRGPWGLRGQSVTQLHLVLCVFHVCSPPQSHAPLSGAWVHRGCEEKQGDEARGHMWKRQ